jgi:hypothetical protein
MVVHRKYNQPISWNEVAYFMRDAFTQPNRANKPAKGTRSPVVRSTTDRTDPP